MGQSLWIAATLLWTNGLDAQSLHFAVIGDSGTGDHRQIAVAQQMERYFAQRPWQFVLMLGGNIYDNGEPAFFDSKFKTIYKPLMDAGVKFHATLGNHDRRTANGAAQVRDPAFGFLGQKEEYVLQAGPQTGGKTLARFIALNSEAWREALRSNPAELDRRRAQLRSWLAASDQFHWNIVFFHEPLYSYVIPKFPGIFIWRWGHGPAKDLRKVLEPELKDKVQLVFSGHEHFYQRIRPQSGITYIISGGAGKVRKGVKKRHAQVEKAAEELHFMDLEASAEELRYTVIAASGQTIDQGSLRKAPKALTSP